jgi:hypothetical protein
MPRIQIPSNIMRLIAHRLIADSPVKRTSKKRPIAKSTALRTLIKTDPTVWPRVVAMAAELQNRKSVEDLAASGLTLLPASEDTVSLPPDKLDPVYQSWTPEEKRAWRITWAIEAVKSGAEGPNRSGFGGASTAEELQTAKRIIAGELKPTAILRHDCEGSLIQTKPDETPAGWTGSNCPDQNCPRKTNYFGHFHHELYPMGVI